MSINSISNSNIFNSFRSNNQDNIQTTKRNIASGQRINRAADDAAGQGIVANINTQIRSLNASITNAQNASSLLQTADGALSSMSQGLQRVRELAVQASNNMLTKQDRQNIQAEVKQQLAQVQAAAQNTQFNSRQLLDGSFTNMNMVTSPSGAGMQISIADTSLQGLGLSNFDITGDIDFSVLDNAISQVTMARSNVGAMHNNLSYAMHVSNITSENLSNATLRIGDTDVALKVMRLNKERILEQYQTFTVQNQMQQEQRRLGFVGIM